MFQITIIITKLLYNVIRYLRIGAGYAWPGRVAMQIYPEVFVKCVGILPKDTILITGTNGKTTTAKLITHIFEKHGYHVISNNTGGNLLNGIVSTILLNTDLKGKLSADMVVFEVDELALLQITKYLHPKILALLNLSRDQLDRYWELDFTLEKWRRSFIDLNASTDFVVYEDQPELKNLFEKGKYRIKYFDSNASNLEKTSLLGNHNAQNINCALAVVELCSIKADKALAYLSDFDYAYGRGEVIEYKHKNFQIFLAKNPASFNNNLELLLSTKIPYDTLLFVLNDNIPDGRDVSWIYDIDPKNLLKVMEKKAVYISGTRALDMLIRLKYAGMIDGMCNECLEKIVKQICQDTKSNRIVVLPNYSSMLKIRKILKGRGIL